MNEGLGDGSALFQAADRAARRQILRDLLLTFMSIGLFTFGGGYAMLAMMERVYVERKGWITHDEMMNLIVVAESTPGPVAINCATFIGWRMAGLSGALTATAGTVIPSFAVIYGISLFLDNFLDIPLVAHAFQGIRLAVALLILDAAFTMFRKMPKKKWQLGITGASFLAMFLINLTATEFSAISLMCLAALLSLGLFMVQNSRRKVNGHD